MRKYWLGILLALGLLVTSTYSITNVYAQSCDNSLVVDEMNCVLDSINNDCDAEFGNQVTLSCDQNTCYANQSLCTSDDAPTCEARAPGNCFMSHSSCSTPECYLSGGGGGECSDTNGNLNCRGKNIGDSCPGPGECVPNGNTGADGKPACMCDDNGGGGGGPNNSPIGYLDAFFCSYNAGTSTWYFQGPGWAGDADNPNAQLRINYYVDDPGASDPNKLLGYVDPANTVTCDADVLCNLLGGSNCSACAACANGGSQCQHRADLINLSGINAGVQATLTNGSSHTITARAINIGPTGSDAQLTGSVSKTCTPTNSCSLILSPNALTTFVGASGTTFTATVGNNSSPVNYVSFNKTPNGSNIGSFSPPADNSIPYTTVFTPANAGSAGVTAVALLNNGQYCTNYSPITVNPVPPPLSPSCTILSATSPVLQGGNVSISCTASGDPLLNIVRFYYTQIVAGKNYCTIGTDTTPPYDPVNQWVQITPVNLNLPFPFTTGTATATLNTSLLPVGSYYISANIYGTSGNMCTGNPQGSCSLPSVTHCPNCLTTTSVLSCIPSCLNSCGQNNGCGGSCPNTDNGTPNPPIVNTPGVGGVVNMTSQTQFNFSWLDNDPNPSRTDNWQIKIYNAYNQETNIDAIPCGGNTPTSSQAVCVIQTAGTTTYAYNASSASRQNLGDHVKIAVRAHNANCSSGNVCSGSSPFNVAGYCSAWVTRTATLVADVNGTFYYDVDSDATTNLAGRCVDADVDATLTLPSTTVTGTFQAPPLGPPQAPRQLPLTNANSFNMTNVPYWPQTWSGPNQSYNITLPGGDPANTYVCTCPAGCTQAGVSSPDQTNPGEVKYFVNLYDLSQTAWWQVFGGHVFGPNGYTSSMPQSGTECTSPTCIPYLVGQEGSGVQSAGIPISSNLNLINSGGSSFTQRTATNTRVLAADFSQAQREDYDYFAQNIDLATATPITSNTLTTKPSACLSGSSGDPCIYYYDGSLGDLTISPTNTWSFTGQKHIFFVNGNLVFNNGNPGVLGTLIGGDGTSFVAFIVNGDITFNSNVGFDDPAATLNAAAVQGLYVADGWLRVKATLGTEADRKFIGSGTFVGWSGVELERDFADSGYGAVDNKTYATETFRFRPTLLINYPDILRKPDITWQESN